MTDKTNAKGVYTTICYDSEGNVKWTEKTDNLITTTGKNYILDSFFSGSAYTSAVYSSLFTAGTPTTSSTYASPIVTEVTSSIITIRATTTFTAASGGTKNANVATFPINGTATVTGNMLLTGGAGANTVGNTNTTSGAAGVLVSAALFTTAKSVTSGDTITVSYSISI